MRVDDRCQAHRCAGGGVGSTRITETELAARNRRAGFPAPQRFADRETKRDSAARGPLQTAAAVQHRHGAGGRRFFWLRWTGCAQLEAAAPRHAIVERLWNMGIREMGPDGNRRHTEAIADRLLALGDRLESEPRRDE
jgi:hypothetical protein